MPTTSRNSGPVQLISQILIDASVGGATLSETPRLDVLLVFVRAGAIIARQPAVQSTSEIRNRSTSIPGRTVAA